MITKSLRYFLYARKSSENEDKQVASIPSQIEELKNLAKQYDLKIVGTLTEEKSAKAPGRPVFSQMIDDIHNGKADGIICWKLDRLARNPIDGGTISWMLQQSRIKHIQTFQRSYYPTDNVLMMNLEFGMANQFILDLSVNTKRGIRNKINDGWLPHKPPLGYLNNKYNQPDLPPIYSDPVAFPLMKELWKILLEKRCSLERLHGIAHKIGLKTYNNRVINRSSFYSLFKNPFYYGHILWQGEVHPGKHEPMITKSEFDEAQGILSGRRFPISKQHVFAFTGLIRCGECGAGITAEEKFKHQKNGNKHHYTYYRCTKHIKRDCSQRPMRDTELEIQIADVLKTISIPPTFHQWAIKYLKEEQSKEVVDREEIIQSQQRSLEACRKKLDNLFNMRVSGEIEAQEYNVKKKELMDERLKFEELLKDSRHRSETWLDRAEKLFSFAETAKKRFETGTLEDKRDILSTLGSNFLLKDRILNIPVDKRLALFQTVAPEVQELHNRLEPRYPLDNIEVYERNYAENEKWGLKDDTKRSSQLPTIQLLVKFHKRRRVGLRYSIDDPFPQERQPKKAVNIIREALYVKAHLKINPSEHYIETAEKLKIDRKRIPKLMTVIDRLPADFQQKLYECPDNRIHRVFNLKRLYKIASFKAKENMQKAINSLMPPKV